MRRKIKVNNLFSLFVTALIVVSLSLGLPFSDSSWVISSYAAESNYMWPVPSSKSMSRGYGYYNGELHDGLDITGAYGCAIVASKSGTVYKVVDGDGDRNWQGYGHGVVISHGDGYYTHYAHMANVTVSEGQSVSQGQQIGGMGDSGNADGTHLHFAIATSQFGGGGRINNNRDVINYVDSPSNSTISGGTQVLSDGNYHIVSALDETKGIDIVGCNTNSGTNIDLYSNLNDSTQVFTVKYLGNGFYSIRHRSSKKSLDVYTGALASGTNVQLYDWNESDAQQWVISASSDNRFFYIRSKCNGLYLDVDGANSSNGANIQMYSGNGSKAQMWRFILDGSYAALHIEDGKYEIASALNINRCIEVKDSGTASNTNVQLNSWKSKPNQVFDVKYIGNGYYEITDENSGKVIDLYGGTAGPGSNIQIYQKNNSDAQRWMIKSAGDGYFYIICKASGQYLDVYGASNSDGANIQGYFGNGTKAQKWKFIKKEHCEYKGHNIVIIPAVSPTCTVKGLTEGKKCSVCGKIIVKQNDIPAKGHVWDNGKITTAPTETNTGIKTYTCSICGKTKQETIPATGVGTISKDGKTLIDESGVTYRTAESLKNADLKKNLQAADKKSGGKYKITKIIKKNGKVTGGNVTYMAPYNKNCTKATAGATVKLGGVSFKITAINANAFKNCKKLTTFKAGGNVTTIGKNAFNGCSSLKTFTITSKNIKSIGANAFKGINAKAKMKVPKQKLKKYTKMIQKAKAPKTVKITK